MRILIVRTSALGDVVHCLPVLSALRRQLPDAKLGWVIEAAFAPLLYGHPDLDQTIVARTRAWRQAPLAAETRRDLAGFRRELDDFGADVALDLMGNHKSAAIAALSMADRRIGLERGHRREPSSAVWLSEGCEPLGRHAVERALSMLEPLGLSADDPPDFGADRIFADARPASGDFVALLPGAGWENKRYPTELWGEVAARIGEAGGPEIRVLPGPGEEGLAHDVAAASRGHARVEAPGGLDRLASELRGARLVLGGDTGPVHLAVALGTKVLCLMGPTDPELSGPYGAPEQALWKRLPCSFCHKRLDEPKACLHELPPRAVAERALGLL